MSQTSPYAVLIDPSPSGTGAAVTLVLPGGLALADAAEAVDALLNTEPEAEAVDIVVDGVRIGRTTRSYLGGSRRYVGTGDGATLPGHSAKYRIVVLECAEPGCDQQIRCIHVDESRLVACPDGHTSGWLMR